MTQPEELRRQSKLVKDLIDFYKEPARKLIGFLYHERYTQNEIAQVLGVTKQAINIQYPKHQLLEEYEARQKSNS